MAKRVYETKTPAHPNPAGSPTTTVGPPTPVTREYIHSLRGKFKGKDLLNTLIVEKLREKN